MLSDMSVTVIYSLNPRMYIEGNRQLNAYYILSQQFLKVKEGEGILEKTCRGCPLYLNQFKKLCLFPQLPGHTNGCLIHHPTFDRHRPFAFGLGFVICLKNFCSKINIFL